MIRDVLDLTAETCKFPVGEPGTPEFHFCGAEKPVDRYPYCAAHMAVAYVVSDRKRRAA